MSKSNYPLANDFETPLLQLQTTIKLYLQGVQDHHKAYVDKFRKQLFSFQVDNKVQLTRRNIKTTCHVRSWTIKN